MDLIFTLTPGENLSNIPRQKIESIDQFVFDPLATGGFPPSE